MLLLCSHISLSFERNILEILFWHSVKYNFHIQCTLYFSHTNVSMKKAYIEETDKDLDQGWAWMVLFAATSTVIITGMFIYCAGVLHIALLQKFEEDNAYTSLIGSIYTSMLSLGGM